VDGCIQHQLSTAESQHHAHRPRQKPTGDSPVCGENRVDKLREEGLPANDGQALVLFELYDDASVRKRALRALSESTAWMQAPLTTLIAVAAVLLVPTIWGKPWSIEHFYGRVFLEYMFKHPQMLSAMRIL
jgi:hypothetical protein